MIHLIAPKDKSKWPKIWFQCFDSIKKLPYDIKFWDTLEINNELISDDKDFFNQYLDKLDPIYKYDYIRYLILERYGGIYMDMDVEIKINFLQWLNPSKIYIAEGENNTLVSNHIMISPPDHLFWYNIRQAIKYRIIERFEKCKQNCYWTLETCGPIGLSYILIKGKYKYTPLSRHHFGNENSNLQFCIHHTTHNWTKNKKSPYIDLGNN